MCFVVNLMNHHENPSLSTWKGADSARIDHSSYYRRGCNIDIMATSPNFDSSESVSQADKHLSYNNDQF